MDKQTASSAKIGIIKIMKTTYIYIALVVLLVGGLIVARNYSEPAETVSTKYDDFAQCLADEGAKFFGAYWCPHCKDQKDLFENSSKLSYIECSLPNQQQNQLCTEEGITGYPTWKFANGDVESGVLPLSDLAARTNCVLPE